MIPIDCKHSNQYLYKTEKSDEYEPFLKAYYKALIPTNRSQKVMALDAWCKKNIHLDKDVGGQEWSFKDVVCVSPENLVKLKNLIDNLSINDKKDLMRISSYVVTILYNNRLRKYGARQILEEEMDVHICPYCNRNLIYQIKKNGSFKTTCELDHFFSKGGNKGTDLNGYALLAASFYNLIPACQYCNGVKGEKELKAFYPHLFKWKESEKIRFTFYPSKIGYITDVESFDIGMKIDIKKDENTIDNHVSEYKTWRRYDVIHDLDTLNILEIYQNNKRDVQGLLWKNTIISDDYVSMLYESFGEFFDSKSELRNLVLDKPNDFSDIARMPLGKLKYDIYREIDNTD